MEYLSENFAPSTNNSFTKLYKFGAIHFHIERECQKCYCLMSSGMERSKLTHKGWHWSIWSPQKKITAICLSGRCHNCKIGRNKSSPLNAHLSLPPEFHSFLTRHCNQSIRRYLGDDEKLKYVIIFKQYFRWEVILRTIIISLIPFQGLLSIEVPEHCSGNKFLALWPSENLLQVYIFFCLQIYIYFAAGLYISLLGADCKTPRWQSVVMILRSEKFSHQMCIV